MQPATDTSRLSSRRTSPPAGSQAPRLATILPVALVLSAFLGAPNSAAAQRTDVGDFRLSLGTLFAAYDAATFASEDRFSGREVELKSEGFVGGLARAQLGLSARLAAGLWLGATFRLTVSDITSATGSGTDLSVRGSILAHLEYVFLDDSAVRPYLKFLLGGSGLSAGDTYDAAGVTVGGGVGLHLFPVDNVSVTPAMQFDYTTGGGSIAGNDAGYSEIVVGAALSLTAWFGGGPDEPLAEARPPWQTPPAGAAVEPGRPMPVAATMPTATQAPVAAAAPPDTRRMVLLSENDDTLSVIAAPQSRPGQIAFHVRRLAPQDRRLECSEVILSADLRAAPTTLGERSSRLVGTAVEDIIVGVSTPDLARDMTTARDAGLLLCGEVIWLTPASKSILRDFLDRYAEASAPEPPPASPDETQADDW